jgi:hypothetical protein
MCGPTRVLSIVLSTRWSWVSLSQLRSYSMWNLVVVQTNITGLNKPAAFVFRFGLFPKYAKGNFFLKNICDVNLTSSGVLAFVLQTISAYRSLAVCAYYVIQVMLCDDVSLTLGIVRTVVWVRHRVVKEVDIRVSEKDADIILSFFEAFAKLLKVTISFVMSVRPSVRLCGCPHGTTRLALDGFWWNLIFKLFSQIYREN